MKTFIIQEKFVGYADITIYAETEDEAISLYNRGYYADTDYDVDDLSFERLPEDSGGGGGSFDDTLEPSY